MNSGLQTPKKPTFMMNFGSSIGLCSLLAQFKRSILDFIGMKSNNVLDPHMVV